MESTKEPPRRATVDDLEALKRLWREAGLGSDAPHMTDFQVVPDAAGGILAAAGLRIDSKQGLIHHVAIAPNAQDQSAALRKALLERILIVAKNHGLFRLWTPRDDSFWAEAGFGAPAPEVLERLPAAFGQTGTAWLTLQLRDEAAAAVSLEREFDLFRQAQRDENEQILRQARVFKVIAWVLLAGFLIITVALIFPRLAKRFL